MQPHVGHKIVDPINHSFNLVCGATFMIDSSLGDWQISRRLVFGLPDPPTF